MVLPDVQHPKNPRKRFPQLAAFLEMLNSIFYQKPTQLQPVALTRVRSSVVLIGMSTHEECGASEIANERSWDFQECQGDSGA